MSWFAWWARRGGKRPHGAGLVEKSGLADKTAGGRRGERRKAAEMVRDAEAFLAGRLVERAEFSSATVPVWAWTNLLAHGSARDLEVESTRWWSRWDCATAVQWRRARAYLAGEVLVYAGLYGSLAEVQQVVLVPLELRLAAQPAVAEWRPNRWALEVETALAQQNHAGHHG